MANQWQCEFKMFDHETGRWENDGGIAVDPARELEDKVAALDRFWSEYKEEMHKYGMESDDPDDAVSISVNKKLIQEHAEYQQMRGALVTKLKILRPDSFTPEEVEADVATGITHTIAQMDTLFMNAVADAVVNANRVICGRIKTGSPMSGQEQVGQFVTDLRRAFQPLHNLPLAVGKWLSSITKTQNWIAVGVPVNGDIYSDWKFDVPVKDGVWRMNGKRASDLCERVMMNATYVPEDRKLDHNIASGLAEVEAGISRLNNFTAVAHGLNQEAVGVTANLQSLSDELEEMLDAA